MSKSNQLGDIPGARFLSPIISTASLASGDANARISQIGPFPYDIRVRSAWWTPTGGNQAATATGSYRRLAVYNGGPAGTGTSTASIVASLNLNASRAQYAAQAMTADRTIPVAAGDILYASHSTVGGTDAGGTVVVAGQLHLSYEIV